MLERRGIGYVVLHLVPNRQTVSNAASDWWVVSRGSTGLISQIGMKASRDAVFVTRRGGRARAVSMPRSSLSRSAADAIMPPYGVADPRR
jgi:hypothetical protein